MTGRFPRRERLTSSAEFQAVFRRGHRIERPSLLLLWVETGGTRRVGFAVSRQLNRAVDRNRIRRRLREAYRRSREVGPGGATMVVVGKKRVLKMRFDALVNELAGALGAVSESVPSAGGPR